MPTMLDPLKDVRGTSSGTLATLTGKNTYSEIDAIQSEWYNWLLDQHETYGRVFDNWVTAWNAYVAAHAEKGYRVWE